MIPVIKPDADARQRQGDDAQDQGGDRHAGGLLLLGACGRRRLITGVLRVVLVHRMVLGKVSGKDRSASNPASAPT